VGADPLCQVLWSAGTQYKEKRTNNKKEKEVYEGQNIAVTKGGGGKQNPKERLSQKSGSSWRQKKVKN